MNEKIRNNYTGREDLDFGYWNVQDLKNKISSNNKKYKEQKKVIEEN